MASGPAHPAVGCRAEAVPFQLTKVVLGALEMAAEEQHVFVAERAPDPCSRRVPTVSISVGAIGVMLLRGGADHL